MTTYTTIQGDTFDIIAAKVYGYGYENRMLDIVRANPEHLDTLFFNSGIILKVPELRKEAAFKQPPWKR